MVGIRKYVGTPEDRRPERGSIHEAVMGAIFQAAGRVQDMLTRELEEDKSNIRMVGPHGYMLVSTGQTRDGARYECAVRFDFSPSDMFVVVRVEYTNLNGKGLMKSRAFGPNASLPEPVIAFVKGAVSGE